MHVNVIKKKQTRMLVYETKTQQQTVLLQEQRYKIRIEEGKVNKMRWRGAGAHLFRGSETGALTLKDFQQQTQLRGFEFEPMVRG